MKTQATGLTKLLMVGVIGAVVVGAVMLLSDGSGDGFSTVAPMRGEIGMAGDIAIGRDADDGLAYLEEKAVQSAASPPLAPSTGMSAGGGSAVTNEGAGAPGGNALLADDRKIVQTASIRLEVEEVGAGFEEVGRVAAGSGGFVASSSFSNRDDAQVASMTIRVPTSQYQTALSELRRLGVKVVAEDSKSADVTAEYTDLGARLRNLEATETQLLVLLERAVTINEILQVQDRLNNVRGEIEQVKGRMGMLDKLTELATITVHLEPSLVAKGDGGSRLGNEISAAWDASIEFLTDIAAGAIHVIVFAWWVPVIGLPLLFIGSRLLRSRPRPIEAVD